MLKIIASLRRGLFRGPEEAQFHSKRLRSSAMLITGTNLQRLISHGKRLVSRCGGRKPGEKPDGLSSEIGGRLSAGWRIATSGGVWSYGEE